MINIWMTWCNDVNYFVFILYGVDPTILNDELELCDVLSGFFFRVFSFETVAHDSDKHIQQVDTYEEAQEKEKQ